MYGQEMIPELEQTINERMDKKEFKYFRNGSEESSEEEQKENSNLIKTEENP